MIRDTEHQRGDYTLSVRVRDAVKHYNIYLYQQDNPFGFEFSRHNTFRTLQGLALQRLVDYYRKFDHLWTPIYIAAKKGYLYLVKILATLTDNPNAPSYYGETPIYAAAKMGYVDIVKVLAPLTDNPNAPGPEGLTPIEAAIRHGYEPDSWTILELVQILEPLAA